MQGGALSGLFIFNMKVDKPSADRHEKSKPGVKRKKRCRTRLPPSSTGRGTNAPVMILMFQTLCLSALLSSSSWGLGFHQLFHPHALPFSLTVILILDISLETQLYISIVIWLGSSENLSYSIKRFSDSFACHQLELLLSTACYQSNIEIIFV